jgi:hypothetical protein
MPATTSSLGHLSDRFAGLFEQAERLYQKDQTFRGFCDVHAVCARGVKRSAANGPSTLGAEYAAQQMRVEIELLRRLQTPPGEVS